MLVMAHCARPRERRFLWLASACLALASCTSPAARPVAPAPRVEGSAALPPAPSQLDTHGIRLEPLPDASAPSPLPLVEIVEPAFGDLLEAQLGRRTALKLRVENTALTADREGVLVALDGQRPRRWLGERPLVLGDLVPADADIAPGTHVLLAVAVGADGRSVRVEPPAKKPLSLVSFFVGARPKTDADATPASVFCLSPAGTFYTKPGDPLPFEVLAFGTRPTKVSVRTRSFSFELPFDPARAYALHGLPQGDTWLSVGSAPQPTSECVLTSNPAPEARP